jgi:plasmid stabilization system protein ParE
MIQIQLSKLAQQDLKDIWRGLAEYRLELADKQIKKIEKKIALLKQFPLAGRQRDDMDSAIRCDSFLPEIAEKLIGQGFWEITLHGSSSHLNLSQMTT